MSEPYIWKHKNGSWYIIWREKGKQKRKSLRTKEKRIANIALRHFREKFYTQNKYAVSKGETPLLQFIELFINHKSVVARSQTIRIYYNTLNKAYLFWGNIKMQEINHLLIDRFLLNLIQSGLKPPTINKYYRHLKSALKKAIIWQYIPPENILEWPKALEEEKQLRFLTSEQLKILFKSITHDEEWFDFILFTAYSGLRSGEVIRLKKNDIDNPSGFLRISSEQKNKDESRIPINKTMREIINRGEHRKNGEKLFRFNNTNWVSHKFKNTIRKANLPDHIRFHDLRHTFATHLMTQGVNIKFIQDLLRHKSLQSTMVYATLSPEHLKGVSNSINFGDIHFALK